MSISYAPGVDYIEATKQDTISIFSNLLNELRKTSIAGSRLKPSNCVLICLAIEGVFSEPQKASIFKIIQSIYSQNIKIVFISRGLATLAGGLLSIDGIVIRAGIRAFSYSLDSEQQDIRVGGWGPYTGEDGGAYSIGCMALYKLFRAFDDRESESISFSKRLLEIIGASNPAELIEWINNARSDNITSRIADLARAVDYIFCHFNDPISKTILENAVNRMMESFSTVLKRLGHANFDEILLYGGLIQNSKFMCESLVKNINNSFRDFKCYKAKYSPIVGALIVSLSIYKYNILFDHNLKEKIINSISSCSTNQKKLIFPKYKFGVEEWSTKKL